MMGKIEYGDLTYPGWPVAVPHIRFKGVWDMQDLYEFMINYFRERKYKFYEKNYKHKHPSPFGVERQYVWHAEKRMDERYLFEIETYIHTYDAHDIQVKLRDGSIRTFTRGRIWMEFHGIAKWYHDDRWKKSSFAANLRLFIINYIDRMKWYGDLWDMVIYREIQKLVWLVRRRLKMEYDEYEQKYFTGVHR